MIALAYLPRQCKRFTVKHGEDHYDFWKNGNKRGVLFFKHMFYDGDNFRGLRAFDDNCFNTYFKGLFPGFLLIICGKKDEFGGARILLSAQLSTHFET